MRIQSRYIATEVGCIFSNILESNNTMHTAELILEMNKLHWSRPYIEKFLVTWVNENSISYIKEWIGTPFISTSCILCKPRLTELSISKDKTGYGAQQVYSMLHLF